MAAIDTGKSFANGEQLTAAKLNQMFGNSTFASGAVDNSTMTVNSLGQLAVNQVTSSNIATNALNLDDIQQIDTDRVLGRLSDETGNIEQITVDEDLTSVSANHDQLATSKAIKDYIDSQITATTNQLIGVGQTWQSVTRALDSTEYTNNTGRPIMLNMATAGNTDDHNVYISIKPDGGSYFEFNLIRASNSGGGVNGNGSTIIPDGSTYKFRKDGDAITFQSTQELR